MAIARISNGFGMAVRNRRTAAGLSQEKLAEREGLHSNFVGMVERAVRNPTLQVTAEIAAALHVGLLKLVEEAQQQRGKGAK